jgi:hypothetical protein
MDTIRKVFIMDINGYIKKNIGEKNYAEIEPLVNDISTDVRNCVAENLTLEMVKDRPDIFLTLANNEKLNLDIKDFLKEHKIIKRIISDNGDVCPRAFWDLIKIYDNNFDKINILAKQITPSIVEFSSDRLRELVNNAITYEYFSYYGHAVYKQTNYDLIKIIAGKMTSDLERACPGLFSKLLEVEEKYNYEERNEGRISFCSFSYGYNYACDVRNILAERMTIDMARACPIGLRELTKPIELVRDHMANLAKNMTPDIVKEFPDVFLALISDHRISVVIAENMTPDLARACPEALSLLLKHEKNWEIVDALASSFTPDLARACPDLFNVLAEKGGSHARKVLAEKMTDDLAQLCPDGYRLLIKICKNGREDKIIDCMKTIAENITPYKAEYFSKEIDGLMKTSVHFRLAVADIPRIVVADNKIKCVKAQIPSIQSK